METLGGRRIAHCALSIVLCLGLLVVSGGGNATAQTAEADARLEALARRVVTDLSEKRFAAASADFDEKMRAELSDAALAEIWTVIEQNFGSLRSIGEARFESGGGHRAVILRCEFERQPLDGRVVFDDALRISGLYFSLAAVAGPDPPGTVVEREVTVGEGTPWPLGGTLTLPRGEGPFPAVVLVHGSGPLDRDSTVDVVKPFRDLAWGLAERGIAVLRYDKRTFAWRDRRDELRDTMTVDAEVIDDARAAVALLRTTDGVDARRIFIAGHSLGGMLAPRVAAGDPPAGLILMAPSASLPHRLIPAQAEYIMRLDGQLDERESAQLRQIRIEVGAVDQLLTSASASTQTVVLGAPAAYWRSFAADEGPEAAARLDLPILILHGGRDYQVTAAEIGRWRTALQDRANVTIEEFPALNHLFIAGTGPSTPLDYRQPGRVDAAVIEKMASWIRGVGEKKD